MDSVLRNYFLGQGFAKTETDFFEIRRELGWEFQNTNTKDFISDLNSVDTGLESPDIDLKSATKFLQKLTTIIRIISEEAYIETSEWVKTDKLKPAESVRYRPIDKYPELKDFLDNLVTESDKLSRGIRESSKIYKVARKIQDTHFLELYNEGVAA